MRASLQVFLGEDLLNGRPDAPMMIIDGLDPALAEGRNINGETLFQLGRLMYQSGAEDRALDHFEQALAAGFTCLACLENDAELFPLLDHPRWLDIVHAVEERRMTMLERCGPVAKLSRPQDVISRMAVGIP